MNDLTVTTMKTLVLDRSAAWTPRSRTLSLAGEVLLAVSASLFLGLCAQATLPLTFTPVPITLQTFGLFALAFVLGSRRALLAAALYLVEGASGMPVFSPAGPGGVAQLLGPTGGYLFAYPAVAYLAGRIFELRRTLGGAVLGWLAADVVLYASGALWLMAVTQAGFSYVVGAAVFPFLPGDVLKAAAAISLALGWKQLRKDH